MRSSRATNLICALAASILLSACPSQPVQSAPDAVVLLQNIPPANPAKYADAREKKVWQNPYLIIRAESIGLLSGVSANEERLLKPEEVLDALASLPPSAWPYGRVAAVLVQEEPGNSEPEKVALRRNRGAVAGALESAHTEIVWMVAPTAKDRR